MTDQPSTSIPWHTLTNEDVATHLSTREDGLSPTETSDRLREHGPNELKQDPGPTRLEQFLNQFRSPLVILLMVAAGITLIIGEYVDASVIMVVVLLNAVIGYFQEHQAEESVRALRELMTPTARVIRSDQTMVVDSRELVPGDLVLLESGARVPADLRLITTNGLLVDESTLTGESAPVHKQADPLPPDTELADRANMAYAGTTATLGRGRGYVVATGGTTQLGSIALEMRTLDRRTTPLQDRLDRLAKVTGVIVAVSATLAFAAGVAAGRPASEMFLIAVAVAVSAVPEGLPIAFTITLAVGVRRMAKLNAIVRRLPVVETLGSTTIIGSDKTGTLTENRMTVQRIWSDGQFVELDDLAIADGNGDQITSPQIQTLICGALTNEASLDPAGVSTGDPTEVALLAAITRAGLQPDSVQTDYPLLHEIPFEPERGFSAALRQHGDDSLLFLKGSPERITDRSIVFATENGTSPIAPDKIQAAHASMAAAGGRVLAMACRPATIAEVRDGLDEPPEGLIFLGLQSMSDPPRGGAREAIRECRSAGIRTTMITGDHALTARAIASDLDIPAGRVITGGELAALSDEELDLVSSDVSVFARVTPEQKLRIVRSMQRNGEVVAVTGDGVNDAPALRAADIGIAMGKRGTDVAKEASDMVLADDNFVTIVEAVEQGRITFDNVRKVVSFLFTTNAAEVLIILGALLLDWPLPMIAVQILWLNLVTDSLQVMALAFEPGEPDAMSRPPTGRDTGILSRHLWQRVGLSGVVMTVGTLGLFDYALESGETLEVAQTLALTTMVLFQMFQAFNSRSEYRSLLRMNPFGNPLLLLAVAVSIVVHAGALYLPATQYLLRVEPLSLELWGMSLAVALSIVIVVEIHKAIGRHFR